VVTAVKPSSDSTRTNIASNRRALHDYFVVDHCEAGIELRGTEVKSIRDGNISLVGSFARIEAGEAFLDHLTIPPYHHGNRFNHDPERRRRLLLHRKEILRLQEATDQKGFTLIPLSLYFRRGRVKIELAVCRGKSRTDKRQVLRQQTDEREAARAMAAARK
jgi:SsrA-binding protein